MQVQTNVEPWWAALTVWVVVNAVNVLQTVGFISRLRSGSMALNHLLGYAIMALAIPAGLALIAFLRAGESWQQWLGPAVFLAFIILMVVVEYIWPIEFRSPPNYGILIPYLLLFFGAILLMGLPMYHLDRRLWLVTVVSSVLLMGSMGIALRKGVG